MKELRAKAELVSYEVLQWKKLKPNEEMKEEMKRREEYDAELKAKEVKEEEKRK